MKKKTRKLWTSEEVNYLVTHYPDSLTENIATKLKRPICSIYGKASLLGLSKNASFYDSDKSGRLTSHTGAGTRFTKGGISWNKGKKMTPNQNSAMHHFPKGHIPHNTKVNGQISERANKSKPVYTWIRIEKGKWVMLHVKNWTDKYGPVPKGYIVVFKDGNRSHCEIENLELITREENMARNTISRWPEELQQTIKALNKLKKHIENV